MSDIDDTVTKPVLSWLAWPSESRL